MFFDPGPTGGPWGDPPAPECKGCRRPIGADEPTAEVDFEPGGEQRFDEMNGLYHAECARPILGLKRALETLRRGWFPGGR